MYLYIYIARENKIFTFKSLEKQMVKFMMILFVKLAKGKGHKFCQLMKSTPKQMVNKVIIPY